MSSRPKVVAITGTIGAGKSLVGRLLAQNGYIVIDTDEIVHRLFATDFRLQRAIADRFGKSVLDETGTINRPHLAALVFNNEEARKDLEAIVHPAVIAECDRLVQEHASQKIMFFLVPLLFEAGLESKYDETWTVFTEPSILKQRLRQRTNLPDDELDKRIEAQMPQAEKVARAHKVIDNSGTTDATAQQLVQLLNQCQIEANADL